MIGILKLICIIIGVTIIATLVFTIIPNFIFKKWVLFRHPDYNRTLTPSETKFIENAREAVTELSLEPSLKKKWFGTFYFLGFMVIMISLWGILFWAGIRVYRMLNLISLNDTNVLYSHVTGFGFSAIIGLFASIILAAWCIYFISGFVKGFWVWMALTQSTDQRELPDSILARRIAQIEHDIRIKRLNYTESFSAEGFLRGIVWRHKKYYGYPAYILMGIACIFFIFDMRARTTFFKDRVEYTQYWSGKKISIDYSDITAVEAECAFGSKGALDVSLRYSVEEQDIATIEINNWVKADGLSRLNALDEILRANDIEFAKSTRKPSGKPKRSAYLQSCFQKLSERLPEERYQTITKILHTDELVPD